MGPPKYDPSKSEAYKALQEEEMDVVQEVKQPARGAVFAPQKANQNRVSNVLKKKDGFYYDSEMYRRKFAMNINKNSDSLSK